MTALLAKDVHRIAIEILGPTLVGLGFRKRGSSFRYERRGERFPIWMWLQIWRSPGPHHGGQFLLAYVLDGEPGRGHEVRLPEMMQLEELDEMRRRNDRVVDRLPPPDPAWLAALGPRLREGAGPRRIPEGAPENVLRGEWFRYQDESDVRAACDLVQSIALECVAALERCELPSHPAHRLPSAALLALRQAV